MLLSKKLRQTTDESIAALDQAKAYMRDGKYLAALDWVDVALQTVRKFEEITRPAMILAPCTPKQISALEAHQNDDLVHPYTCPNRGDHADTEGVLKATENGWVCPQCDYTQTWAFNPERG